MALVGLLAGSPTRKIQTTLALVFINYRFEPTVLVRQVKKHPVWGVLSLVALVGLEPTLLAELDFESSASTNSATGPKRNSTNYFAAALRASTFFTKRALRFALCAGFLAGFSATPSFLFIAFFIAAISGVKRDGDFDIT